MKLIKIISDLICLANHLSAHPTIQSYMQEDLTWLINVTSFSCSTQAMSCPSFKCSIKM